MTSTKTTGKKADGGTDGTITRMRLALSPRFAAEVIELDDEEVAKGLFPICSVTGCLRFRSREYLCETHHYRWKARGKPAIQDFMEDAGPATKPERIDLSGLPPDLRVELGLAIQLLAADPPGRRRFTPQDIRDLTKTLKRLNSTSLSTGDGREVPGLAEASSSARRVHTAVCRALERCSGPPNASAEFDREVWRLEVMGFTGRTGQGGVLRFSPIPQPWLRLLAKRFMRWRIATGTGYHQLNRDMTAIQRLADAFTEQTGVHGTAQDFSRETIEVYMGMLHRLGLSSASRSYSLSSIAMFLRAARENGWEPGLTSTAGIHLGDHPRRPAALPRALPEYVMAQIEDPQKLDRLQQPHRLMMQILIRTGLRLADTYRLAIDCLVIDQQNAPYLRYVNHKMSREAILPIDEEVAAAIKHQARSVLAAMPGARYLAPAPTSQAGDRPWDSGSAAARIANWQADIGLCDEQGHPFRFTAHQLRHTYATRLINADVPQEVVRRLLDHESHEMTARYARLKDETVRRHWEQATKINIRGETISPEQGSGLNDAAWMKENLGRVTMALPNGYCGLPLQQSCPHANACLTCPVFVTTPDFLTEHLTQLRSTKRLIAEAETAGQKRMVEMNVKVASSLENIINAIQTSATNDEGPADAN